jgi:manganese oxidase
MAKYKLCFAILAFLCVADAGLWAQKTRHYYIQAEDVIWDFAPSNQNLVHGGAIPEPWTNSHVFPMVRYIQYTDASFSTPKHQPSWLGVLGPIIRAEVGDEVVVLFRNRAFKAGGNYGMHPHGFRYTKDNEGAHYNPAGAGAEVPPGGQFEYHWFADEDSGPGLGDPSSLVWWYHSHVNEPQETNLGLLGPIIITRRGMARPDGSPRDVNREFVTAFFIFHELSGEEPGLMHSINGYIFGNLRGLEMNNRDKVRWYLLGMGNEVDLHTPHWHGKTVKVGLHRTDVVELLPASMVTADMRADNPGSWMFHCHVADHIEAGMMTTYTIR